MKKSLIVSAAILALALISIVVVRRICQNDRTLSDRAGSTHSEPASQSQPSLGNKLQPYIACINRFSERVIDSRDRYASWAPFTGPTGHERNISGTYTISDPGDCAKGVTAANAASPHDAELEAAGTAYTSALTALAPLLKDADDYYTQEGYKDDKMAKGKELHPKLVAAWKDCITAERRLRSVVERLNDQVKEQELEDLAQQEGRKTHYYTLALMIDAKKLERAELTGHDPDLAAIQTALDAYKKATQDLEQFVSANSDDAAHYNKSTVSDIEFKAKEYLASSEKLMRRIRDKTPYSESEMSLLKDPNSSWMVDASPGRVNDDYNKLVQAYNTMH